MTFLVNGIKEENKITTQIELLVETESDLLVRKILDKYTILVLSLKEYDEDPKKFGDIRIKIQRGMDQVTLRSKQTDIEETCKIIFRLGVDVKEINSVSKPISQEAMQKLLDTTREAITLEQKTKQVAIQTKKTREKKIYADPRLAAAQKVVIRIFQKSEQVTTAMKGDITRQELEKITLQENELRKLRMGNNYEKIKESCVALMKMIESLEERYFAKLQPQAKEVITDSVLTDIDIQMEMMRQSYAMQTKLLGARVGVENQDYALFGNLAFCRKFFQKDFVARILRPIQLFDRLYAILEFSIGFILVLGGTFLVYNIYRPLMDNLSGLYIQMIKVGCLGLLIFIGKFWKKPNILNLLLIYTLTILGYRLLTSLIVTNFAL